MRKNKIELMKKIAEVEETIENFHLTHGHPFIGGYQNQLANLYKDLQSEIWKDTYLSALQDQSKDLVAMIEEEADVHSLYALCSVYQQLSHSESNPPCDAYKILQEHRDALEKHIIAKDINDLFYSFAADESPHRDHLHDLHELSFVLDYLDIEDDYSVAISNLNKIVLAYPEVFSSLSKKAEDMLSLSIHKTRFFDEVLESIQNIK